jgi:hypothetical protein
VAQPLERKSTVEPDVIMRSIWVHGSYMKALDRDILLGALELHTELLESGVPSAPALSSFFQRGLNHTSWQPSA